MGGDQKTTYTVEVEFRPSTPCDRERLEDFAADVADVLDEKTSDVVLGSAVTIQLDPPAIGATIDVAAESPSEMHRHMADVLDLLEQATADLARLGYSECTRSEPLVVA